MSDWTSAGPASPPRRFSAANSASLLWTSQYNEPHGNIWNSCSALKPSSSIWGSQIRGDAQMGLQPHFNNPPCNQMASPQLNIGKLGSSAGVRAPSQRFSPVSAMNAPLNSVNPLWFDDPYLVSPPPSPDASSASDNTPVSTTTTTPFQSPIFASASMASSNAQEEFIISPASGPLYFVQFKGERIDVFTAPGTAVYHAGEAVMVDADRGRDLGTILAANVSRRDAASLKQRQSKDRQNALHTNGCGSGASNALSNGSDNNGNGPTVYNPKQILGVASSSEISDMIAKINDESSAIALCNRKANERRLDMRIVDAEYQWDRRKLTFFYTADTRVDFRDLVRELFRIYKTRIWMCATTARS